MQCTGTISSGGVFFSSGSFKTAGIKTLESYNYLYIVFDNNLCFESHVGVLKRYDKGFVFLKEDGFCPRFFEDNYCPLQKFY